MDTPGVRGFDRLGHQLDVARRGAGETAHAAILDGAGDRLHRFEIAGTRGWETRLDDVHLHFFQQLGDTNLLFASHGRAGALLAIAQSRIENN